MDSVCTQTPDTANNKSSRLFSILYIYQLCRLLALRNRRTCLLCTGIMGNKGKHQITVYTGVLQVFSTVMTWESARHIWIEGNMLRI